MTKTEKIKYDKQVKLNKELQKVIEDIASILNKYRITKCKG